MLSAHRFYDIGDQGERSLLSHLLLHSQESSFIDLWLIQERCSKRSAKLSETKSDAYGHRTGHSGHNRPWISRGSRPANLRLFPPLQPIVVGVVETFISVSGEKMSARNL